MNFFDGKASFFWKHIQQRYPVDVFLCYSHNSEGVLKTIFVNFSR